MEKNKNEVAVVENTGYAVAVNGSFREEFADDLNGIVPTFEKIKIPSGGGIAYEVPGDDPESPDIKKEFSGVIVYHHPIKIYYKDKFDGANNPPDCGSMDGKFGVEQSTGEVCDCSKCPKAKFGSAEDGAGKACKEKRRVYVLREGDQFPTMLTLPTGSIKEFGNYIMKLLNRGKKSNTIVTKFTLKKVQNSTGINYSQAVLAFERNLNEQEVKAVASITEQVKALANMVDVAEDEEHEEN